MDAQGRPEDERIDIGALLGAILSRWLRVLVVTAIALGVTFAILLFVPRLYESTAGLLVEQRANIATTASSGVGSSQPSIPVEAMMSSQIELIRSRDTLLSVIDSENLRSEAEFTGIGLSPVNLVRQLLGRPPEPASIENTVLTNLLDRLTVVRERDSAVISINVRSRDPDLAARIANAVADAHVQRRTALSLSDTATASDWLEREIAQLRIKVREADDAVANYRVENDLFVGSENRSLLDQQLTAISTQITAAQERKNAAQSRASLIRQLVAAGRPIDSVQDVRNSVVIQQLSQTKATLQGELAQRSSTLLPNHPTVRALAAQVNEIEQQINREARSVADALEAEASIEADLEQSLRDDLARLKLSVSDATRDTVTLDGLEREARAQRDLLEAYLLRYSDAISRTNAGSALPDVRQITIAAPSATPASPKTALILGAVGFVALALQIGGILFGELMSGRAITDHNAYRQVREPEPADEEEPAVADLFDFDGEEEHAEADRRDHFELEPFDLDLDAVDELPARAEPATTPPRTEASDPALPPSVAAAGMATAESPPPAPSAVSEQNAPPRPSSRLGDEALELSNLSADVAIGRVRVVMLAALGEPGDCESVADVLIADALRRGLSIVRIDAGGGRQSAELGLTDLSLDRASFGDVVHRVREGLAEVPWGQEAALERRSMRPLTLIEALVDIYEVVIVMTGRIGMSSTLPMFAGVPCRLVLVGQPDVGRATIEAAVEDAANLGFEVGQIVSPPQRQPEVA